MKKSILLLFAALLPLVTNAHDFEVDGIYYNITSGTNKTVEVTFKGDSYSRYDEYSGSITIPATVTYDGVAYSVTSIGGFAFRDCSSLTAINIPEGVTSIGDYAFYNCSSLTSITIPEVVTDIGGFAFSGCSSLTSITIPERVTSIGNGVFSGCTSLISIVVEEGNTKYDSREGCNAIIQKRINQLIAGCSVTIIPSSVTSIGAYAFYGCRSLTSIILPEGVTSIGSYAFRDCSSLTAITIPESVTSIGAKAFYDCTGELIVNCNIPSALSSTDSPFYHSDFYKITIGEKVTSIGAYAFYGCYNLTTINISEGVTSIGNQAFGDCSSLTAITIPEGVTSIGANVFRDCRSLTFITIPASVTSIGVQAFCGCSNLTTITIPEGVKSLGQDVFRDCSSLTSITLPESVTSIGSDAFNSCSSLTTIVLPKNLKNIYSEAFANCSELLDVYIHAEEVPSTNTNAFNFSYPEYITLHVPDNALESYKTSIPWSSFGKIVALGASITEITLSESSATLTEGEDLTLTMTTNPENADRNLISWSSSNPSVATVDNTGKVTAIAPGTATITATANDGSGVSAQCEVTVTSTAKVEIDGIWYNLTSETLQAEVTFKGSSYYEYSNEYSGSITIPATVTYGGKEYSVTSIGNDAFADCSSLTAITCHAMTPPTIGASNTFNKVTKSIPVYVPAGSVEAYKSAQYWSEFTNIQAIPSTDIASGPCGDNLTWRLTEEGELVIEGTGEMYDFSSDSQPWTEYRESIQTIIIADGVTSIGDYAFFNCSSLTAITIPEGVTSIGTFTFSGCSKLASITIPKSVTSIGEDAFSNCSSLTAITIPEGVTSIGDYAFCGCSSLTAITIPESVTSIGEGAFGFCSSLTSINIPVSVTSIGDWAFEQCTGLTAITCNAITPPTIGSDTFDGVEKSIPVYVPAGSVEAYKSAAYWRDFTNIQAIPSTDIASGTCGDNLTWRLTEEGELVIEGTGEMYDYDSHGSPWYEYSGSIQSISLSEGMTSIGDGAFFGCSSLTAITIPEGVTSIGEGAFSDCESLTAITVAEGNAIYDSRGGCNAIIETNSNTLIAGCSTTIIPEGVTSIGNEAFSGCSSLTAINIPESVTSIGYDAFYNCSSLTAITIPEGVTSIGEGAFWGCSNLTAINIPERVTSIERHAFYECRSLTAINIPEGVTSIEEWTFADCSNLTAITIPESMTSIGNYAFYSCSSLTAINIPEGVTSIGGDAFSGCSSLTAITIPEGVTSIGKLAFSGCNSLTAITVAEGNAVYDSRGGCNAIIETNSNTLIAGCSATIIPEGVTSIGSSAFASCRSLTDITIPEGVTSIGDQAFAYCSSLTAITIPEGVTSIGSEAFFICSSLTAINIPESVTSIGSSAFTGCRSLTSITCEAVTPPTIGVYYTFSGVNKSIPVYVPAESVEAYESAAHWSEFTNIVGVVKYSVNFIVDEETIQTLSTTANALVDIPSMDREGYTFSGWTASFALNLKENADAMLYSNAPCTETTYGDQFVGWHVLFDGNANTFFHSEYKSGTESADGLDHYLRVDMGEGNSIKQFTFTYTVRGNDSSYTPTQIVVEGSNEAFGDYEEIAVLTDLPTEKAAKYTSEVLGNGVAYRYIRYRVTETRGGGKVMNHPYFYFAEFDMEGTVTMDISSESFVMPAADIEVRASFIPNNYDVTFIANGVVVSSESLTYGSAIVAPEAPEMDGYTFVEWEGLLETVPARDVEFVAVYRENVRLVESITLNQAKAALVVDESLALTATVTPDNATDASVVWSSSNPDVAIVNDGGVVTAIAPGVAVITATANDGSGVNASCEVTVDIPHVTITINQYGSGTYSSEYALDFNEVQGLKAYAAAGYDTETGVVTLLRVNTAKAGIGLFVKGTPGETYEVPIIESTSSNVLNMLVATSEQVSVGARSSDGRYANYKYTILQGTSEPLFYCFEDGFSLGAGKAYLQIPVEWLPAKVEKARSIRLRFDNGDGTYDDEGTTSIDNSQLTIDSAEIIYDLMGRRVTSPQKGGLYIVDGKKVIY